MARCHGEKITKFGESEMENREQELGTQEIRNLGVQTGGHKGLEKGPKVSTVEL
jgi:hypothetical protein